MKKHILSIILLLTTAQAALFAQSSETVRNYINKYKDIAIEEMIRTGVPASITLAQGIHETGAGTSQLVLKSNNHFGIKCKTDWKGERVYHDDDARGECFRKYDDAFQSYRDHSDFLKYRPHYASLFELDPLDYKAWAHGLKKAGYATNPKYPQILIKLIEDYQLQDYSLIALNMKKPENEDAIWASNTTTVKNETAQPAKVKRDLKQLYPAGVFEINRTRVIVVSEGTSFLKVANEHDISLKRLFEFNDMEEEDVASEDRLIFLQRKRKQGASEFHVVQEGETVYDIAQTEGIRLEELLNYNFLKPGMQPAVGEKLYLQENAPAMPKLYQPVKENDEIVVQTQIEDIPVTETQVEEIIYHTVQAKETAYSICRQYGITLDELKEWNGMTTTDLKIGQELKIKKKK